MPRKYTEAEIKEVGRMWRLGLSVAEISEAVGRTEGSITSIARDRRDECPRRQGEDDPPRRSGIIRHAGGAVHSDAMRLMDDIPDDTRDMTARMFGDPLKGRSALDRKAGHSA